MTNDLINPREQAEKISDEVVEEHFLGVRSEEAATQKINSFKQHYDQGTVNSLYRDRIAEYLDELELVNQLAKKFNLPKIQNLVSDVLVRAYWKLINKKPRFRNKQWQIRMSELEGYLKRLPADMRSDIKAKAEKMKTVGVRE